MAYALPPEENANSSILTLHYVSKTYHMGELDVPVLHNLNLVLRRGEIAVIVGPSGSGKSTLLNIMGGIDTPTDGEVFFDGNEGDSVIVAPESSLRDGQSVQVRPDVGATAGTDKP